MTLRTTQQSTRLHTLIAQLGLANDVKRTLIWTYSSARTESSRELTSGECEELILFLAKQVAAKDDPANRMRKKIFSHAHTIGWTYQGKVDTQKVRNWMLKFSFLHKDVNDYTLAELPKLITQFKKVK